MSSQFEELTRRAEDLQHKVDEADSILAKHLEANALALAEVKKALAEVQMYDILCSMDHYGSSLHVTVFCCAFGCDMCCGLSYETHPTESWKG